MNIKELIKNNSVKFLEILRKLVRLSVDYIVEVIKNTYAKTPQQIKRLLVLVAAVIIFLIILRVLLIPFHLFDVELHQKETVERVSAAEIKYAGSEVCKDCHDEIYLKKNNGYHKNLSCEICHEASQKHAENNKLTPTIPEGREYCQKCHQYSISRPSGFPQINPVIHNPLKSCSKCHDPHNPEPSETPKQCGGCHTEIFNIKAVSHHVFLECTECHTAPQQHKITPRLVKPSKPVNRDFCGKCHSKDSKIKEAPKIDISSHGEKYVCWQCHYPHMPEAN